MKYLSIFG